MERKKYDSHIRQCLDDTTRIMSHLDSTFKPGFSLAYSVLSALETLWQLRYINSHLPYHTIPQHSTGFQCTREGCSRLWCWCGSVLMALLPATSAFLLPLLQVTRISGQPQQAYCKFLELEPWSAGGASPSRDLRCGLLLCGDQRWPSSANWRPIRRTIRFTSDVLMNGSDIHLHPALL